MARSRDRIYTIWQAMISRCTRPKNISFPRYGGRGISVCPEWAGSFATFREWATSNGYRCDLTIDRIDSDGDYSPENCRWATYREQAANLRTNRHVDAFGERKHLSEWARDPRCAVTARCLRKRIVSGWEPSLAITTPILGPNQRELRPRGETHGNAKITADDVRAIRAAVAAGTASMRALARHFGIDKKNVSLIVQRKAWTHVA